MLLLGIKQYTIINMYDKIKPVKSDFGGLLKGISSGRWSRDP